MGLLTGRTDPDAAWLVNGHFMINRVIPGPASMAGPETQRPACEQPHIQGRATYNGSQARAKRGRQAV